MKKPKDLAYLVDAFKSLPSIGTKASSKISYFFVNQDEKYKKEFIGRLSNAVLNLKQCELCNAITEKEICDNCSNIKLSHNLCIVYNYDDYERMIDSDAFYGYYHILCLNDNKKFRPELINIDKINNQILQLGIDEVVIATPFSLVGEAIAQYLSININDKVKKYRLGFGIPLNANIDYIDNDTMREAFMNKKKIN